MIVPYCWSYLKLGILPPILQFSSSFLLLLVFTLIWGPFRGFLLIWMIFCRCGAMTIFFTWVSVRTRRVEHVRPPHTHIHKHTRMHTQSHLDEELHWSLYSFTEGMCTKTFKVSFVFKTHPGDFFSLFAAIDFHLFEDFSVLFYAADVFSCFHMYIMHKGVPRGFLKT